MEAQKSKSVSVKQEDIEEVTKSLVSLKNNNQTLKEMNESLISTNNEFKEELETLKNKGLKMELKIKIAQDERDNLQKQVESMKVELKVKEELESRIEKLKVEVSDKNDDIKKLEEKMKTFSLRDSEAVKQETVSPDTVEKTEEALTVIKSLSQDIKILQAKLQKSREINYSLEEEKNKLYDDSELKLKELRLEYEGKLEKMKNKMVSFYCDIL